MNIDMSLTERNISLLRQYPFCFCDDLRGYIQSATSVRSGCEAEAVRRPYFLRSLEAPLFVQNVAQGDHLEFLNDTMRASEDFAGDNHIYLYYDNADKFSELIRGVELEPLLKEQKFVFLVGEDQKKLYPIDFSAVFGIDYSKLTPSPLRIEEMNRLVYQQVLGHAGSVFFRQLMGKLDSVIAIDNEHIFYENLEYFQKKIVSKLCSPKEKMATGFLIAQFRENIGCARFKNPVQVLENMVEILKDREEVTVEQVFKAFWIAYMQMEKPGINPRAVPIIWFENHSYESPFRYLFGSFKYGKVLGIMREPINMFASFSLLTKTYFLGAPEYLYRFASWYTKPMMLYDKRLMPDRILCVRFEDLKLYPAKTLQSVCRELDIPFDEGILKFDDAYVNIIVKAPDANIKGFDLRPLNRDLSGVLSDFDMFRLKLFFHKIHSYFGYETVNPEDYAFTEEDIRNLFKIPFKFQIDYCKTYYNRQKIIDDTPESLRDDKREELNRNYSVPPQERFGMFFPLLMYCYKRGFYDEELMPMLILPEES